MKTNHRLVIAYTAGALRARRSGVVTPTLGKLLTGLDYTLEEGDLEDDNAVTVQVDVNGEAAVRSAVSAYCVIDEYEPLELLAEPAPARRRLKQRAS